MTMPSKDTKARKSTTGKNKQGIQLYNTFTNKKEPFTPQNKGKIGMYVCGPTVYDYGHVGHARSAIAFDVIRRYFIYRGFKVKFVFNYTDVDDKIIKRAKELGKTEKKLVQEMSKAYDEDYATLGVMKPDLIPRATEHIEQMIEIIKKLEQKGFVYDVQGDGLYYDLEKFKSYGKLSGQKIDELRKDTRVKTTDEKKHPHDFCLWKYKKPGEPFWNAPWQAGRPGWHIECSAMCKTHLGETFDIHGGGIDLVFPHHENEIAQSEGAHDATFARYWMHNGHVKVDDEKMSKSLGNFFTIRDVLDKFDAQVLRFFLLSTHYRQPINFADTLLQQGQSSLQRLWDFMFLVKHQAKKGVKGVVRGTVEKAVSKAVGGFEKCMDDDFEISGALGCIFDLVKEINKIHEKNELGKEEAKLVLETMKKLDSVLNVLERDEGTLDAEIEGLIQEREKARKNKDWAIADTIRDQLHQRGIRLDDTAEGVVWRRL